MKYVFLFLILLLWFILDYDFICTINARGGWEAYKATNIFWHTALSYTIALNMIFAMFTVTWWLLRNE